MMSIPTDLPTEEENKRMEELFLAIYFNDVEKVKEFKNQHPQLYKKKDRFLIKNETPFDLINLTLFNCELWFDKNWIEKTKLLANKQYERIERMLHFWRDEMEQKEVYRRIAYNQYFDYFFCKDPSIFDEVDFEPISMFVEKGFREIDIRLYNRAECFDFDETKKLLEQGAKPDVMCDSDGESIVHRIEGEASYLLTCKAVPTYEWFEEKGYENNFDVYELFCDLIGLAAHEEMSRLLKGYMKKIASQTL